MGKKTDVVARLWSPPQLAELQVWDNDGLAVLDAERKRELRQQLAAGELDELVFRAVTFRPVYPNRNFLRFRDEDLRAFAGSFVNQPFLRDHNARQIEARGGIVRLSMLEPAGFVQEIALTVPRDIEAFLNGQIDRFSISWDYSDITCSVCGQSWLSLGCTHWPGESYEVSDESGKHEVVCELIFEEPVGREVSAVNTPAVEGTGIREVLSELGALRQEEIVNGKIEDPVAPEVAAVIEARVPDEAKELLEAQRAAVLDAKLAASQLPAELRELVREALKPGWRVAELESLIASATASWAKLEEAQVVQNVAPVSGMQDGLERITEALSALIEGRRPENGVRPLSGIREAYIRFSGDYDMRGLFDPTRALAAVDSSTMAGVVANALNKVVVNQFQQYPRWWEPITSRQNFSTLQQVKWITLGGVGELPTVGEGKAYTEMTWDDQTETASWLKKGGYLGITLEAMDKDDVHKLQMAPRALAQAAWLTLSKSIAAIFTSNSGVGPTMSDGIALFNASHSNLGTTALSSSAWAAVKVAMRKQTELNSGERLGGLVVPKFLLVPSDLENTALTVLASEGEPGTANNDVNPEASGNTFDARMAAARRRIVVIDLWTDTNNWAAVADPRLYPSLGLGYRFGETPEIFSVASPNSGLMFSNDVMPIKVRYFFATGPMDYRGLYKQNVA